MKRKIDFQTPQSDGVPPSPEFDRSGELPVPKIDHSLLPDEEFYFRGTKIPTSELEIVDPTLDARGHANPVMSVDRKARED